MGLRELAKELSINPTGEEKTRFIQEISGFRKQFDIHKIWIPIELSEHIESVAIDIDKRCHRFFLVSGRLENGDRNQKQINHLIDLQEEFYDYVNSEIENVFEELTKKITNEVSAQ